MGSESDSGEVPVCMRDPCCSSQAFLLREADCAATEVRSATRARKGSMTGYAMPACSSKSALNQYGGPNIEDAQRTSRSMLEGEANNVPVAKKYITVIDEMF